MSFTQNGITRIARRDFVKGAALAGATGMFGVRAAFADETTNELGIIDALANRMTLHGLEDSMYDPERPVTDEQIELIVRAGFSAPTAVGQQCLEFVVVTDREAMRPIIDWNGNANELNSCPVVICLFERDGENTHSRFYQYDSGMAAMAMQVQASAMGLCSCVMSMKQEDKDAGPIYYTSLGVKEGDDTLHPQLMVALGYPAVDAVASASVNNYDAARVWSNQIEGGASA